MLTTSIILNVLLAFLVYRLIKKSSNNKLYSKLILAIEQDKKLRDMIKGHIKPKYATVSIKGDQELPKDYVMVTDKIAVHKADVFIYELLYVNTANIVVDKKEEKLIEQVN